MDPAYLNFEGGCFGWMSVGFVVAATAAEALLLLDVVVLAGADDPSPPPKPLADWERFFLFMKREDGWRWRQRVFLHPNCSRISWRTTAESFCRLPLLLHRVVIFKEGGEKAVDEDAMAIMIMTTIASIVTDEWLDTDATMPLRRVVISWVGVLIYTIVSIALDMMQ
jgi:hypothetical protein